jgi:hypothetical protein
MKNGRFHPSNCKGKVQKMRVLYIQSFKMPGPSRVVTRTIEDGRMDGLTMAAGSAATWMHCSVCYKVTSRVNRRVRADVGPIPADPAHPRGRKSYPRIPELHLGRCNRSIPPLPPSPPSSPSLSLPPPASRPRGRSLLSARTLDFFKFLNF